MSLKALQDYTFVSKYARYNKELKRREVWDEAVDRVRDMHIRRYPQIREDIEWAFERVRERKVLGSQRALQYGGKPIEKNNARIYNCCYSHCDRLKFFQDSLFLLLAGSGVGFSVQRHHIDKLPSFCKRNNEKKIYIIPDSIEGWGDALGVLLSSYFKSPIFPKYQGYEIIFDYSLIRPKGSPLGSGVGKAPGPDPLKNALELIRELLDKCVKGYSRLRPIDAYDIVMHASDAVLSGGVRRSACIVLFSPDDEEMVTAKTGNWFYENPQRGRSNNSALLIRDKTSFEDFNKIIQSTKQFGEPGFIWADNIESGWNPCAEINLYSYDEDGNSGWAFCNLTEINGKKVKTVEDFKVVAKASAIIGTCQAGYTSFPYLGEVTERIARNEALLGCSVTGFMENPDILLDPKIQRKMAEYIKTINAEFAKKIGINVAARTTCVKPSGTTSCMLGTASGIHPHHAKRYLRRVQANMLEAPLQHFNEINPLAIEKSVWNANGTDKIVNFCIEVPKGAKVKNDMNAIELLEKVKSTQQNWVIPGTRIENCAKPWLRHNVSNTINVKEDEWDDVAKYIYKNRKYFAGVSLLSISGDKDYPQAPFTAIHTPREIMQMYGDGSIIASGLVVDGLAAFGDDLWAACDYVLGVTQLEELDDSESVSIEWLQKRDWIRRANQFAERYFENNIRQMTYCLKDVNNCKLWMDLNREYKDVDYSTMIEEEDNTKIAETVACAGGQCCLI